MPMASRAQRAPGIIVEPKGTRLEQVSFPASPPKPTVGTAGLGSWVLPFTFSLLLPFPGPETSP